MKKKKQDAPQPDQPQPDQPAPPPAGEGGTPPAPTPAPTPAPAPDNGAAAAPAGGNTDEELAKMAAEAEKAAEGGEGTVGSEVIEVTGSLVDRKTLDTPAPVTVIDREILKASGQMNVGTIMQNLPAQSNGVNVNFNNGGDGSTRVNLRGIGPQRTLVLLNGRRMVPSGLGADSSVDLNVIPLAMVERIEVLKDGASAIYGSDAIGGVVNVITRSDFRGTEVNLYTGGTSHGDGYQYDASFVTGSSYAKGNVVFAGEYSQQDPIFAGDREFGNAQRAFLFEPDYYGMVQTAGSSTTPNGKLKWKDGHADPGNAAWDALATACPSGSCTRDSLTGPYRDFNFNGNSDVGEGDLYNFQPENYLTIPMRRYNVFSQGTYKLSDHINAEYEALYVNRKSQESLAAEPIPTASYGIDIDANSVYNPFGRNVYNYARRLVEGGDRVFSQNVDMFRMVAGLNGEIPEDAPALKNWKWELSFNYGRTEGINVNRGSYILSHLVESLGPSFIDSTGTAQCGDAVNGPTGDGCIPVNLLAPAGQAGINAAQLKWLGYTGIGYGFNDQKTALAQAHGQLAKTPWDGDIAIALGADYRQESGGTQPDPLAATNDTTTNFVQPIAGSFNVAEAFGELSIVPVTNRALAKYLEIDAAFRAYDYNTFGSGVTWKLSALYKIPQGFSIRGTYSTAFRAPNISDLYSGSNQNFPAAVDPCDTAIRPRNPVLDKNCGADGVPPDYQFGLRQVQETIGGNPNLKPETATVATVGAVFEPKQVKGLAATLDYYRINIKNAITTLGADIIMKECYTQAVRNDCNLITRDAAGDITNIVDNLTNVGGVDSSGLDYAISYDHDFGTPGRFRFNFEGVYLLTQDEITQLGKIYGIGVYDLGAFPRYKFNFSAIWGKGHLGGGVNARYIASFKECDFDDCSKQDFDPYPVDSVTGDPEKPHPTDVNGSRTIESSLTADVYVSYSTKDALGTTSLSVGVNNIADTPPPFIYNGFYSNTDASTYDFMGRYMYARLTQMF